ncbi:MAG: type II secretion system F family protein [bacterium]|nr:type II secretion system F family protein [bacterium]
MTRENKILQGALVSSSQGAAAKTLAVDGATLLWIRDDGSAWWKKDLALPSFGFSKPEQINFFRNLSTMLGAGLSIAEALRVLQEQIKGTGIKKSLGDIISDIENGKKLSDGMRKHPSYFSEFLYETVGVGEVTGKLTDVLERISVELEHDYEITRRVRGAMAYPIVVVVVMFIVIVMLTAFILPKIADLFSELKAELPLPTRILLGTSAFVERHPFIIGGAMLALAGAAYALWRKKETRYYIHYAILKMPIFGELAREFNLARFFRALEALFVSGVSLVRSVDIAKKILKNDVYRSALEGAHPILIHGAPLTEALHLHPFLFPLQTRRIVEVGERTGKLEDVFSRISAYYERALKHKTQMLASLIEPLLILMIGFVVGGLALSVFLPIYQLSSAF